MDSRLSLDLFGRGQWKQALICFISWPNTLKQYYFRRKCPQDILGRFLLIKINRSSRQVACCCHSANISVALFSASLADANQTPLPLSQFDAWNPTNRIKEDFSLHKKGACPNQTCIHFRAFGLLSFFVFFFGGRGGENVPVSKSALFFELRLLGGLRVPSDRSPTPPGTRVHHSGPGVPELLHQGAQRLAEENFPAQLLEPSVPRLLRRPPLKKEKGGGDFRISGFSGGGWLVERGNKLEPKDVQCVFPSGRNENMCPVTKPRGIAGCPNCLWVPPKLTG